MASPPHSQPQHDPDPKTPDQDHPLQTPQTQTLEAADLPNPQATDLDPTTEGDNHREEENPEADLKILDHGGHPTHHNLDPEEQIGMSSSLDSVTVHNELSNPPLPSPANQPRRQNKRKKPMSKKKQQEIERKQQTLEKNLKPIPFVPCKKLDFVKHESLLKRLGLWDFVHVEFDRNIRVDLIIQLIAYYESRCSYVNNNRINVSRADLARALKLKLPPMKKVALLSTEPVDLDSEEMSEESKAFVEELVSNWVLLHEDTWMTPDEVLNWTRLIKDGHPEKVDWASLIWFMVDKELTQGEQLGECYYASHLQCLIKMQKPDLLLQEPEIQADTEDAVVEVAPPQPAAVAAEVEVKEEEKEEIESCELKIGISDHFQKQEEAHEAVVVEEPNVELTLGQEIVEKEEEEDNPKVADLMEVEEENKVEEAEPKGNWLGDGKNMMGNHFMQPCRSEGDKNKDMDIEEEMKPEEEVDVDDDEEEEEHDQDEDQEEDHDQEEEADDDDVFGLGLGGHHHNLENDVLTGHNLLQEEASEIPYNLPSQFCDQSNIEFIPSREEPVHANRGGPSIFGNSSKREIEHDDDDHGSHEAHEGSNKRMRTEHNSYGHNESEFDVCMEQVHLLMGKARMMYAAKEQACQQSTMNQEVLLSELERRAQIINHLNGEIEKKNAEIYRFERELYVMTNVLEDYREALKKTQKDFSEYRKLCQYPEEQIYKDAGPGGLVLTAVEVENLRLKQEEDERLKWVLLQENAKELDAEITGKFEAFLEHIGEVDKKLMGWKNEVALLKEISAKKSMVSETEAVEKQDTKPMDTENEVERVKEEVSAEERMEPAEIVANLVFEDENLDNNMMVVTDNIGADLVEENEVLTNLVVDMDRPVKKASVAVEEEVHLVVELPTNVIEMDD